LRRQKKISGRKGSRQVRGARVSLTVREYTPVFFGGVSREILKM
jgi:hypothetical protein